MAPRSSHCAVALLLFSGAAAVCQQSSTPPVIVQPGAPGQASTTLNSVTAAAASRPPSEADIRFMQDMIMHHGQAVEMTEMAKTRAKNPAVKEMAAKINLSQGDEIRWMKQWLTDRGIAPEAAGDMQGMHMDKPATVESDGTPVAHLGHENSSHTAHTNSMAGMTGKQQGAGRNDMPGMAPKKDQDDMAGMDMSGTETAAAKMPATKVDPQDVAMMVGMLTPRQMATLRASTGTQFDRLFLTGMMQHHNGALLMVKDLFQQPGAGQDPQLFDFATDVDNTQLAEIDIMKGILRKVNP